MPEEPEGRGERRWVVRWAKPAAVAVTVGALAIGVRAAEPQPIAAHGGEPQQQYRMPRFVLTLGSSGSSSAQPRPPWVQIHGLDADGQQRLVDSVAAPSPSAEQAREIIAGPDRTFLAAAWRAAPCQSTHYRFSLTEDGHATGITPITAEPIPALVAGLAISPDGRRIAYATAPCADDPATPSVANSATTTLTVLDTTTGHQRSWTAGTASVVGAIGWARNSRTLGYTTGEIPSTPDLPVGNIMVRALDTDGPGTDLLGGRVLFRPPDDSGTVITAVMNPDGRTGYGVIHKGQPPSTVLFSFTEGEPMHVTRTIPAEPEGTQTAIALAGPIDEPRYACLTGIDAFGRVIDGTLVARSPGPGQCSIAYDMS